MGKRNYKGKLEFEGEYLKGEKNGKGIEYFSDGIIKFEGDYKNGKKHGQGKDYDIKNNVISELKNGKGFLKELDENGKLKFEGEYLNGEKNGKGKEYYRNGKLFFQGEYKKGKKWNGKGYDESGNYSLFLFHFFLHLNILLHILISLYNYILSLLFFLRLYILQKILLFS